MPSRRDLLKTAAALPLATVSAVSRAAPAMPGPPLAGHFTAESVRLWLQATEPGTATLRYWRAAGSEAEARSVEVKLAKEGANAAMIDLAGLEPATTYRYRVHLEGGATGPLATFRTARKPGGEPADFKVYLGSCAYTEVYTRGGNPYGANHHIFDTMAAQMAADRLPHFMLWLGDNLYLRGPSKTFQAPAEYSTPAHMELRYRQVRAMLQLRKLFAATHHYAIWDDHDYGPNNADKAFEHKDDARRIFNAYWPNPPVATAGQSGIWTSFRQEDAEFFLLDSRWNRDAEGAPLTPDKAMFGREQVEWLKAALAGSKATFKIVAGGSQFFSQGAGSGWHRYPNEREDFLAWLAKEKPRGLVFLSGDRHHSVVFRHEMGGYAVEEFTCSPFTSKVSKLSNADRANSALVKDCVVEDRNFGTLEILGHGSQRRLTARSYDADGKENWSRVLATA